MVELELIDVGKDNNGFKLILKDSSGKVVKVLSNTLTTLPELSFKINLKPLLSLPTSKK